MPCADTIAALSSAAGASPIAIIRVSGPEARGIAGSLCPGVVLEKKPGFHTESTFLEIPNTGRLSCDIYFFRAPNSYTTEDVIEVHLPGSPLLIKKVLLELATRGARPAEPGEFTRRAYLGGRIDLAEAEAVVSVINARTGAELKAASQVLNGALSELVSSLSVELTDVLTLVEAGIDFSDQDIEFSSTDDISVRLGEAAVRLESWSTREPLARVDMPRVLICGAANVGKSSLFNRLVGKDRVLTSSIPGTTRDVVSAELEVAGSEVLLLDSAGRKDAGDEIESLALSALEECLAGTDVAMFVVEAHHAPAKDDLEFYSAIECRKILVANKSDLGTSQELPRCLMTSCVTGDGIDTLQEELARVIVSQTERYPDTLALSVRQRDALSRAGAALKRASEQSEGELQAADLREGIGALGEITGETLGEELLDKIFSQFCIGK